jgi:hypothetical protein
MKAMLLEAPGRPLRNVEMADPVAGPGQVLLRVRACTVLVPIPTSSTAISPTRSSRSCWGMRSSASSRALAKGRGASSPATGSASRGSASPK